MLSKIKPNLEPLLAKLAKKISGVNPNTLTVIGIIPQLIFLFLMITGHYFWALISIFGNLFDLLDGAVARANGKTTAFGAFLDSTLDRISDFIIISAFGFAYLVRGEIVVVLLCVSFLISYVRSRAELASDGNLKMSMGLIERTERIVFIFLTLLLNILYPDWLWHGMNVSEVGFLVLALLSAYTLWQRVAFAYKNL